MQSSGMEMATAGCVDSAIVFFYEVVVVVVLLLWSSFGVFFSFLFNSEPYRAALRASSEKNEQHMHC